MKLQLKVVITEAELKAALAKIITDSIGDKVEVEDLAFFNGDQEEEVLFTELEIYVRSVEDI